MRGRHRLYRPEEAGWSEAQVSLLEPMPLTTPSPALAPPTILPAAPCGQQLCSARLCSTLLSSAPGRPPPPCPPPPSSCCHHSPLIALRGWGPQGWTHPTVAPEPSWSDGRKVGRRTPEPEVGSVPGSLTTSSRSVPSGDAAILGSLRPAEATSGPSSQTSGPKAVFYPRCT